MDTPDAIQGLLTDHLGFIRRIARPLVRDESAADDLVQETGLAALRAPAAAVRAFRPWVRGVVTNLARLEFRSRTRRDRREREMRPPADPASPERSAERSEILRILVAEVARLEEPFLTTVMLRYFDGLTTPKIARRTGVPEGTVRSRLCRALQTLRGRLDARCDGREAWSAPLLAGAALGAARGGAAAALIAAAVLFGGVAVWIAQPSVTGDPRPVRDSTRAGDAPAPPTDASGAAVRGNSVPGPAGLPAPAGSGLAAPMRAEPFDGARDQESSAEDPDPPDLVCRAVEAGSDRPLPRAQIWWLPSALLPTEILVGLRQNGEKAEARFLETAHRTTAGEDGGFRLPYVPGGLLVLARQEGWFARRIVNGPDDGRADLRMRLEADQSQEIEVVDAGGRPGESVPVVITVGNRPGSELWRGITRGGRATIRHVQALAAGDPGEALRLGFGFPNGGTGAVETSIRKLLAAPVRLILAPTVPLRVEVRAPDGMPVPARVRLLGEVPGPFPPPVLAEAVTAAGGVAVFPHLEPGRRVRVEASDPGKTWEPVTLDILPPDEKDAPETGIRFEVRARMTAFVAVDAKTGDPLRDLLLRGSWEIQDGGSLGALESVEARSDSEGRVRLSGPKPGIPGHPRWRLSVADAFGRPDLEAVVSAPDGLARGDNDLGRIEFPKVPALAAGRVADGGNRPVPGAVIKAEADSRSLPKFFAEMPDARPTVSGADGRFVLRGRTKAPKFQLAVSIPGRTDAATMSCVPGADDVAIVIGPPASPQSEFARRSRAKSPSEASRPAGRAAEVSVLVAASVPPELLRARVRAEADKDLAGGGEPWVLPAETIELPDGARRVVFRWDRIPHGLVSIAVGCPGGRDAAVSIVARPGSRNATAFQGTASGFELRSGPVSDPGPGRSGPGPAVLPDLDLRDEIWLVCIEAVGPGGAPCAGAEVTILSAGDRPRRAGSARTDDGGQARVLTGVREGTVVVRAPGLRSAVLPLADDAVRAVLAAGLAVDLDLATAGGEAQASLPPPRWVQAELVPSDAERGLPSITPWTLAVSGIRGEVGADLAGGGRARLVLPAPGRWRITWYAVPPRDVVFPPAAPLEGITPEFIDVVERAEPQAVSFQFRR